MEYLVKIIVDKFKQVLVKGFIVLKIDIFVDEKFEELQVQIN